MAADIQKLTDIVHAISENTAAARADLDDQALWDTLRAITSLKDQVELEILESLPVSFGN